MNTTFDSTAQHEQRAIGAWDRPKQTGRNKDRRSCLTHGTQPCGKYFETDGSGSSRHRIKQFLISTCCWQLCCFLPTSNVCHLGICFHYPSCQSNPLSLCQDIFIFLFCKNLVSLIKNAPKITWLIDVKNSAKFMDKKKQCWVYMVSADYS